MSTAKTETKTKTDAGSTKDRRIVSDRRIGPGRRNMIRFDVKGGDRRSGNARRSTDDGLRELPEDE